MPHNLLSVTPTSLLPHSTHIVDKIVADKTVGGTIQLLKSIWLFYEYL